MNKITNLTALIILFLFVTTSVQAQVRIVFIGNSITVGHGLLNPTTECYPSLVNGLLKQKYGDSCLVLNSGVAGCTMFKNGDYPIWNQLIFKYAHNCSPDVCYIMLGSNDTRTNNWEACGGSAGFLKDYKALIDTFRYRNPHTLFMVAYPPPAFAFVGNIRNSIIENGVIPVVDSIVKYANAELVDLHTPFISSVALFPDKIHPNAQGAKDIATIIYDRMVNSHIIDKAIVCANARNDISSNHELVIYPNPISNIAHLSVYVKEPAPMAIRVIDINGLICIVKSQLATKLGKQFIDLDTSILPKGVYLLELTVLESVYTAKIIKY